MALRIRTSTPFLAAALALLGAPLVAQESLPEVAKEASQPPGPQAVPAGGSIGDAKRGQALAYTCNGCHSIPSYKNVYPTYSVPKLRGQRPEYILASLKAYKSGERSHGTMHSQAASMSEQDMADAATYLAGPTVLTKSVNEAAPGITPPKSAETCRTCHGLNGVGITADFPTLSGQHEDYLARALRDYQKGGRKNPIMVGQVAALTPEDIEQLAAYFSRQMPALETVQKKNYAAN
jgi:cytochrome c553